MKHCYVRMDKETLYTLDVDVEERYHHKRSEDKSIGRAVSTEENSGAASAETRESLMNALSEMKWDI